MKINGREIKSYFIQDVRRYYLEIQLKDGDCPEGRGTVDCLICVGDCQGTYLSAMERSGGIQIIGTIYPRPHVMYNRDFFQEYGFASLAGVEEYIDGCMARGEYRVESFLGGRKKRIYIDGKHAKTFFEKCTFRHAQSEEFRRLLDKLRRDTIASINRNLPEIKKSAQNTDLKSLGKEF
jgi:hypothetical protein